jgi:RNA polymerase-interacting CarD/CdnL/TRCF family regulator
MSPVGPSVDVVDMTIAVPPVEDVQNVGGRPTLSTTDVVALRSALNQAELVYATRAASLS